MTCPAPAAPTAQRSVTLTTVLADQRSLNQRLTAINSTLDSIAAQLRGEYPKQKADGTGLVGPGNIVHACHEETQSSFGWVYEIEGRLSDICDALGGAYNRDYPTDEVDFDPGR